MLRIPLSTIKSRSDFGHLRYDRVPVDKKQRRFEGRYALVPQEQLYGFECRAVIDWITIRLIFGRTTQHQWVQQVVEPVIGRRCYVDVVDEAPGRVSNIFEIRFQEPDLRQVDTVCWMLDEKFDLQALPVVCAIEISVDFRSLFREARDRAGLFMALTRHFRPARDVMSDYRDWPRFAFGEGGENAMGVIGRDPNHPELDDHYFMSLETDQRPFVDACYYVGAKEADIRWRIMDKVVDSQNRAAGTFQSLGEMEKRVRIEVTLSRRAVAELGVDYLTDLRGLRFAKLQSKFFGFVLPTFPDASRLPHGAVRAVRGLREKQREQKFLNTGVIGLAAMDGALARRLKTSRQEIKADIWSKGLTLKPIPRVGRGSSGSLLAYEELNECVGVALRHLGERVTASLSGV